MKKYLMVEVDPVELGGRKHTHLFEAFDDNAARQCVRVMKQGHPMHVVGIHLLGENLLVKADGTPQDPPFHHIDKFF